MISSTSWNLLEKLNSYRIFDSRDEEQRTRMLAFYSRASDCFKRSLSEGHFTGSAWLVSPDKSHVLLTHHKKLDKWLQLGGHADGNPNLFEVAMREAEEESGISALHSFSDEIFDIDIHEIPAHKDTPAHYHYDVRFAVAASYTEYKLSNESRELKWFPIVSLEDYISEKSVLKMQRKWKNLSDCQGD